MVSFSLGPSFCSGSQSACPFPFNFKPHGQGHGPYHVFAWHVLGEYGVAWSELMQTSRRVWSGQGPDGVAKSQGGRQWRWRC